MSDRTKELAKAIWNDPWVEDRLRGLCRDLLTKWAEEDSKVLPPAPLTPEEEYDRYF